MSNNSVAVDAALRVPWRDSLERCAAVSSGQTQSPDEFTPRRQMLN